MTDDPASEAGTEGDRILLPDGGRVLGEVLSGLQGMSGRWVRGDGAHHRDAALAVSDLTAMRAMILEEVQRDEARVQNTEELAAASAFDFDEIRSRIGSRLDRIRNARGTD